MKKRINILLLALLTANSSLIFAEQSNQTTSNKKALTQNEADAMVNRLHEIKLMDLKSLGESDRLEIRKEVLGIKERLTGPGVGGGIYISVGALLLIILILIIIL